MTSARRIAANRANARRSTGPRTAAGRARSARNALRHGLSTPLTRDVGLHAAALALARRLVDEGGPVELARAVAEATVEVWRVRRRRHEVVFEALAHRSRATLLGRAIDTWLERHGIEPGTLTAAQFLRPAADVGALTSSDLAKLASSAAHVDESPAEREAGMLAELAPALRRLDRYERRALARRKFAMRAFHLARQSGTTAIAHPVWRTA
jgi:hypothetical protein